jgi:hypothetical protein
MTKAHSRLGEMSDPIGEGRRPTQQGRGYRLAPALDGRTGGIELVVDVEDLLVPDVMRFEGFLELGTEGFGGFPLALVGAVELAWQRFGRSAPHQT